MSILRREEACAGQPGHLVHLYIKAKRPRFRPYAASSARPAGKVSSARRNRDGLDASIVDPGFIARVHKKLALDQRQAAAIFGGGANAFSRYENGKTEPPLALVKLLMVLDRHPNLLGGVRGGQ